MPLTLAVAALSATEKSQFIAVLKGRAQDLTCAWTLFWEPKDFPSKIDAVIYCPKKPDSKLIADKLVKNGALPIASLPPMDTTASEVPLFVRMPFKPQEVVEALNAAAKRILASKPYDEFEDDDDEEHIDSEISYPLPVALHKVFRSGSISNSCVKLKKLDSAREIICWPELESYYSYEMENHLSADADGNYCIVPVHNTKEILEEKVSDLRNIEPFLFKSAVNGFLPGALFPGLSWTMPLQLLFWPHIPNNMRNETIIRIIRRITLSPITMEELLEEIRCQKIVISSTVNALLVSGALKKSPAGSKPFNYEFDSIDELLFCKSLSFRLFETLDDMMPGEDK